MPTIPLTIELPTDIVSQIDTRLPPGGLMTREELAGLLVTLGLISGPQKIEVLNASQIQEFRQRRIDAAKTGMMGFLREYLDKINQDPAVARLPTEFVIALETVIGAAMGSGWASAAHAVMNLGIHPADIQAACKLIGEECDYKIEAM